MHLQGRIGCWKSDTLGSAESSRNTLTAINRSNKNLMMAQDQ